MTYQPAAHGNDQNSVPRMPPWITSDSAETLEDVAFLSGTALAHLNLVIGQDNVPHALWRDRLALRAAEACMVFSGRSERAAELRDVVHLMRAGDLPGPGGDVYLQWQRAAARPLSVKALHRALAWGEAAKITEWRGAGPGAPVIRVTRVLETALTAAPRAEVTALILADATLAQALGWDHLMPVLAAGLKRADLRKRGGDLRLACHRAVTASSIAAVRLAANLARKAARLNAVAPKLRAKGADEAVRMFLTRDSVAPAALTSLNSDRAARRFCDRLVELGAVHELTGRDMFRLYGM